MKLKNSLKNRRPCQTRSPVFGIMLSIPVLVSIMLRPINNLDEIWNFGFVMPMVNGMVPYKDMNIIITPLAPWLASIVMLATEEELLIFRLCGVILCTLILWMTWQLLLDLKLEWKKAFLFCLILGLWYGQYFTYDYNFLNLLFLLIIVRVELSEKKESLKGFGVGVLCGMGLLTKQTTGVFFSVAGFLCAIGIRKERGRTLLLRLAGNMLFPCVFGIYLLCKQCLREFLVYCVGGITKFGNNKTLIDYWKCGSMQRLQLLIIGGYWVYWTVLFLNDGKRNNIPQFRKILFMYGSFCTLLAYPIFDDIHFLTGAYLFVVLIFFDLGRVTYVKQKGTVLFGTLYIYALCVGLQLYSLKDCDLKLCELNHYRGVLIERQLEERIKEVTAYITEFRKRGEDVYILDAAAELFMLPLDIYHKDYDLMLKGTNGSKDPKELTEKLCEKDVVILALNEKYSLNWQYPPEVVSTVRERKVKINEITVYDVYGKENQ